MNKGLITKPYFYISDYIENHKNSYYDFLNRVRTNNDIISWIKFFLEATIETAKNARKKFENVLTFTTEMSKIALDLNVRPENAMKVIELLYQEPIISRKMLLEKSGLKETTLKSVINSLVAKGLLVETTGYSRNQIFSFNKYISLFRD